MPDLVNILGGGNGIPIPKSLITWATSHITGFIEELKTHEKNPKGLPVWINTYNKSKKVEGGEPEVYSVINYAVIDEGKFVVLESHSPESLASNNQMISMLTPMVKGMLDSLEVEHKEQLVMSILNEYPEGADPKTVIRFTKVASGVVVQQLDISDLDKVL